MCYMPLGRSRLAAASLGYARGISTRAGALEAAPRGLLSAALHAAF